MAFLARFPPWTKAQGFPLGTDEFSQAAEHAKTGLNIVTENNAKALEFFYAFEALALAEKAAGNLSAFNDASDKAQNYFEKLSEDDKPWCEESLKNILI